MKPYYEDLSIQIYNGNCLDVLPELPAEAKTASEAALKESLEKPATPRRAPASPRAVAKATSVATASQR